MNKLFEQIGWGGVVGIIAGGIGLLVGGMAMFTAGWVAVLVFIAFSAGFIWIFWHFMFGPMVMANRLMESGKDGEATIVSVAENGSSMQIGGSVPKPGMRIVLDVRPQGDMPYRASTDMFVSMFELQKYQPGKIVKVKIDANNKMKLIIAEGTEMMGSYQSGAAAQQPSPELMEEMKNLVAQQLRLTKDGEEAPATIVQMKDLGITVNGDNPLVELVFNVKTHAGETFMATSKAGVVRASLYKVQPGKEVTVKFDPKDRSQVMLFHT